MTNNIFFLQRLNHMHNELEFFLDHAPAEDDCSNMENEMYADMANLKNSIELVLLEEAD